MGWIFGYTVRTFIRSLILSKMARWIGKRIVSKYDLHDINYPLGAKEVNWERIKWYANFARHAYKKDCEVHLEYEGYDIYINTIDEIRYIVLTDTTSKVNYISIRGTSNSHNVLQDLNVLKDKSSRLGICLHTGFHRAAEKIADDLTGRLDKTYDVHLTGHSLGGAEAVIVGWYLDYSGYDVSECVTFGQPKVTDEDGTRKMRGKIKITRVTNETDVVSLIPPAGTHIKRYAHVGEMITLLDRGYYCHLSEPLSMNRGVNSFWLHASNESLSVYEMTKELPDHYMDAYQTNIQKIIDMGAKEVNWTSRLDYIDESGLLGEWK